MHLILLII